MGASGEKDIDRTTREYVLQSTHYTSTSLLRAYANSKRSCSSEGDDDRSNALQDLRCTNDGCWSLSRSIVALCPDIDDDEGRQIVNDAFHGTHSGKDSAYPNPVDLLGELETAYNEVDDLREELALLQADCDEQVANAHRVRDDEREGRLKLEADLESKITQLESLRSELAELHERSIGVLTKQQSNNLSQDLEIERNRREDAESKLHKSEADLQSARSSLECATNKLECRGDEIRILQEKSKSNDKMKDAEIRMLRRTIEQQQETIADQRGTIVELKYLVDQKNSTIGQDIGLAGGDEDSSFVEIIDDDTERDSVEGEDTLGFSGDRVDASFDSDKCNSGGFPPNMNRNLPNLRLRLGKDGKAVVTWAGASMKWSELQAILRQVMEWTPEKKRNGKPGVKRREFHAAFLAILSLFVTFGVGKVPNEFKFLPEELAKVCETIDAIVQDIESAGCDFSAHGNAKALAVASKDKARGIGDLLKNKRLKGVDSDSQKALYEKINFMFSDKKKAKDGKAV